MRISTRYVKPNIKYVISNVLNLITTDGTGGFGVIKELCCVGACRCNSGVRQASTNINIFIIRVNETFKLVSNKMKTRSLGFEA
jgi:hypothetical protein